MMGISSTHTGSASSINGYSMEISWTVIGRIGYESRGEWFSMCSSYIPLCLGSLSHLVKEVFWLVTALFMNYGSTWSDPPPGIDKKSKETHLWIMFQFQALFFVQAVALNPGMVSKKNQGKRTHHQRARCVWCVCLCVFPTIVTIYPRVAHLSPSISLIIFT